MGRLFVNNAGKVAVVKDAGLPAILAVAGFKSRAAMVAAVGLSQQCNVQIQPSLQESIYVYTFGDQMGSLRVQGMAFIGQRCGDGADGNGDGVEDVMKYYARYRVARTASHVNVTVGRTVFAGFLLGITIGTQEMGKRFFTYSLDFAALPNFDGLAGG